MNALKPTRRWYRRRFERWLAVRIPPSRSITLDQRRVFIFPSRAGLFFLGALLVMLIAAINYQNNMAFTLVFFLFSLFMVAILHTFSNLSGLTLEGLRARPTFAGEVAEFDLQLRRAGRRHYHSIKLGWTDQPQALTSLVTELIVPVKLFHAAPKRGWLRPARLRVQTEYPLGLLRAWTWIDLDLAAVVYPQPLAGPRPLGASEGAPSGDSQWRTGSEDFYGFRPYRAGDNLRHVLWRAYARGQALQTKQFVELQVQSHWLRFSDVDGDREQRLSLLCYWVLELHRQEQPFGLELPGERLAVGTGEAHRERALRLLALFGKSNGAASSEADGDG